MKLLLLLLTAVVLVAGCAEQASLKELYIPGHGDQIYAFSSDINEALRVSTNDPEGIKEIGKSLETLNIVFNSSDAQDNAYFRVILIDIVSKLSTYYPYEGRLVYFNTYYYSGENWYNSSNEQLQQPSFSGPVLWLYGPATGANETSLTLEGNNIYLRGASLAGLRLASDKLVLLFFQIDKLGVLLKITK